MSTKSQRTLKQQKKRYALVLVVLLVGGVVLATILTDKPRIQKSVITRVSKVELPGDKVSPQEIALKQLEGSCQRLEQKLSYLQGLVLESKQHEGTMEKENIDLRKEIRRLKEEMSAAALPPLAIPSPSQVRPVSEKFFIEDLAQPEPKKIRAPLQEFVMGRPTSGFSNIDRAVPAGATVRAVLVSSVDAPASVTSSSDPYPVKLRVIDNSYLPKGVNAELKGSIILASAYGNLSTERVSMRLERMTQFNTDGDFVETEVTGYVTGEDGRYGIRGVVVDRSKAMIKGAATSGFFSSISDVLQSAASGNFWRRNSTNVESNVQLDLVKQGTLSGTSSAFDKLAEYYIQRADQIQPVIQIAAGRVVDITFTHGAEIGELHTKDKIRRIREASCAG